MPFSQTDFTTDTGTEYKTKIDDNFAVTLVDDDLAANGGKLLQVDQNETITGKYTFDNVFGIRISSVAPRVEFAESDTTDENFYIRLNSGTLEIVQRADDFSAVGSPARVRLFADGGTLHGDATGGDPGLGKINAEDVEINGEPVGPIESAVVELGGDFDAGEEVLCYRKGIEVTITGVGILNHSSGGTAIASLGVIPSSFRPTVNAVTNIFAASGSTDVKIEVQADGDFRLEYRNTSSAVNSIEVPSISFLIT